jgi:hypothetical protein
MAEIPTPPPATIPPKVGRNALDDGSTDGSLEVRVRVLGNELFAISVTADPLNKRWLSWALIMAFVTVIGLSMFGEPLANTYNSLVKASQGDLEQPVEP